MADNPNGPANAPASGGSPETKPAGSATGGDVDAKAILARLEALDKRFVSFDEQHKNLRSLHDRQMDELRAQLSAGRSGNARQDEGDDTNAASADNRGQSGAGFDIEREQDYAVTKFRVEFPDWQKYWDKISAIGGDRDRARPYVRYKKDSRTGELVPDFYQSLVDIRKDLELQALREANASAGAGGQAQTDFNAQAKADAGAIGGAAASIPDDVDWNALSYDDKIKMLYKTNPELFDPNNLPEALRQKR